MADRFRDKILFQTFTLWTARQIADYNFKCHKSVEYLDLSANRERPFSFQAIFTEERMLKRFIPEREILYELHLDLPKNLGNFYCKNRTEVERWSGGFHLLGIHISNCVYNLGLARGILQCILNERDKIEKLRGYMKPLKFLSFSEHDQTSLYLIDNILSIMHVENCTDSELLNNFFTIFDFSYWLYQSNMPSLLEYVLLQAQKARCTNNLWRFLDPGIGPANFCFFRHKIHSMLLLFKYGIPSSIPCDLSVEKYIHPHPKFKRTHRLNRRSHKDRRRSFFLFQLWYDFRYHRNSPEGLRCMWSCINDPFLSRTEIEAIFLPGYLEHYQKVIRKDCSSQLSPRTLKDLCRVEVRRLLSFNHQLPFGVYGLEIPEDLKLYLNLFL